MSFQLANSHHQHGQSDPYTSWRRKRPISMCLLYDCHKGTEKGERICPSSQSRQSIHFGYNHPNMTVGDRCSRARSKCIVLPGQFSFFVWFYFQGPHPWCFGPTPSSAGDDAVPLTELTASAHKACTQPYQLSPCSSEGKDFCGGGGH